MKIRGERQCRDCERHWSYYETGSVSCPACGSLRSVGTEDRSTHTDAAVTLELGAYRAQAAEATTVEATPAEAPGAEATPTSVDTAKRLQTSLAADELKRELRRYLHKRGFIHAGALRPLDSTYLTACELLEAMDCYDRCRHPTDGDQAYLLALLTGAETGTRPDRELVTTQLREARGGAAARSVSDYRDAVGTVLELVGTAESAGQADADQAGTDQADADQADADQTDADTDQADTDQPELNPADIPADRVAPTRELLERLRDRSARVDALHGDVNPAAADALTAAANALYDYLATGHDDALSRFQDQLERTESV